jgi:hypothetical protein
MKNKDETDPIFLNGLTKMVNINSAKLNIACKRSRYMSVLIQHLNGAKTVYDFLKKDTFIRNDLLNVLYQVYMPLSIMCNNFTHYDLHANNVLLYEPVKGKYIEYHYHITNADGSQTEVTFKCKYIAKIIDYGRCYFNDVSNPEFTGNSQRIYNEVCAQRNCSNCGKKVGFAYLERQPTEQLLKIHSFISSQMPNVSHDLRLLHIIKHTINQPLFAAEFMNMLNKVVYNGKYGTNENTMSGLPNSINNVKDAYKEIERIVTNFGVKSNNNAIYAGLNKLGDLHIYDDNRPMRYEPVI